MKVKMSKTLRNAIDSAKKDDEFWMDSAKLDFAIALEQQRKHSKRTYRDIAASMGKSAPYISKVFRGDVNLTIESMVKLARALDCKLEIKLGRENRGLESEKLLFDDFIAEKSAGQIGHYSFTGSLSLESCNDNLYQSQEYQRAA
jgi:transcriptional regulator with XRE-family HTH domain